eukprot:scaffold2392_cov166-Ochromonas_danica.AAC.11
MKAAQVIKLRPVQKNEEELEEERNLIFELPRKNCVQMAPALKRLVPTQSRNTEKELPFSQSSRDRGDGSGSRRMEGDAPSSTTSSASQSNDVQHRWYVLKKILKRARYKHIDKVITPYLQDLDRSDRIVPNGEVSKKIYETIFHGREFDLYGNLQKEHRHPPRKYQELQLLASQLSVEYTQKMDERFLHNRLDEELLEEEAKERRLRALPKLTTDPWRIGKEEVTYGPVGLANDPSPPSNSLGNEGFYSYNGEWKQGLMHGRGTYLFNDGKTYVGEWQKNRPHGKGKEVYLGNLSYEGEYVGGKYQGQGKIESLDDKGAIYEGDFYGGYRHGSGRLEYPSGMMYEGEFVQGVPHGRGKMTSKLTKWSYEGSFEKGYILGSGVLISPSGERTVYYWADAKSPKTLPSLVRHYLNSKEAERLNEEQKEMELMAPLRALQLRDYVASIRSAMYKERVTDKRNRYNEAVQKAKEQKAKLYETRLRALVGDEEGGEGEYQEEGEDEVMLSDQQSIDQSISSGAT